MAAGKLGCRCGRRHVLVPGGDVGASRLEDDAAALVPRDSLATRSRAVTVTGRRSGDPAILVVVGAAAYDGDWCA